MTRARWAVVVVGALTLVVVADLLGVLRGEAAGEADASPLVGRAAPPLAGRTLTGEPYELRAGDVTVVNVWASWCAPCRHEVPMVARLAAAWQADGVRVVTVDTRDGIAPAREFLESRGALGLLAVHDPDGRIAISWGATGVPETFVLDRRGVVRAHRNGELDEQWLTSEVSQWSAA